MHQTSTDEALGLSDSTYELVNATDTESQDGNFTESMSESIGSLDFHRPEDVHSLADTEHTCDDESLADDVEVLVSALPRQSIVLESSTKETNAAEAAGSDDDDDASRSSLEYTRQSLETPSILTPEASRLLNIPIQKPIQKPEEALQCPLTAPLYDALQDGLNTAWGYVRETASATFPGFVFATACAALILSLYPPAATNLQPAASITASTITVTTTASLAKSTSTQTALRGQITTMGSMGLIPLSNQAVDEWLFSSKKPEVEFIPLAQGSIMIHVAADIQKRWLAKECLTVTATRAGKEVKPRVTVSDEGILVRFPRRETYGIVKLLVRATCRPRVTKVVKVHFGKGILEEALEKTKNLANSLSDMVPNTSDRHPDYYLQTAKQSLDSWTNYLKAYIHPSLDSWRDVVTDAYETVRGSGPGWLKEQWTLATNITETWVTRCSPHLSRFRLWLNLPSIPTMNEARSAILDAPKSVKQFFEGVAKFPKDWKKADVEREIRLVVGEAELSLVEAQITARKWWLQLTGRNDEGIAYHSKGQEYVKSKRHQLQTGNTPLAKPCSKKFSLPFTGHTQRCQRTKGGKGKNIHRCKMAA